MITKEQAIEMTESGLYFRYNNFLHTLAVRKSDGLPVRVRRTGKTKTWKSAENLHKFKIPVKYGLYESFYITEENASEWNCE